MEFICNRRVTTIFWATFFVSIFNFWAESAYADACKTDDWKIYPSSPSTTAHWIVVKGASCHNTVRGLGRSGRSSLDSFAVSIRPSHGSAGVNNSIADHGFGYVASGGYVGHDRFQISGQFHPTYQTEPIPATIDVEVEVVDHL